MPGRGRRVLALTLGSDDVASSRVRVGSVLAIARSKGTQILRVTADGQAWPLKLASSLITHRPDVTILQKVVPPSWFSRILALVSGTLVFECDDAIHLGYGLDAADAKTTSRRLRALLPLCDRVVVSNSVLRQDFLELGARDPVVFPGPAPLLSSAVDSKRRGVVWLGSPSTYDNVRTIVYPALELLPGGIQLAVVGAPRDATCARVSEQVWSPSRQVLALSQSHAGIAPQPEDEWNVRKAFYKVLEYLASGVVPVVPDQPAVKTLLGDDLERVAILSSDDSSAAWAEAISRALEKPTDDQWMAARDRIFARWSAERLERVMIG